MPDHRTHVTASRLGRRAFLQAGLGVPLAGAAVSARFQRSDVRTFDVRVELELAGAPGEARAWVPLALDRSTGYQRLLAQRWTASTQGLRRHRDGSGISM